MSEVPIHYLRTNERDWTPAHVMFFDTETRIVPGSEPECNRLALWCATSVVRRSTKGHHGRHDCGDGTTGRDLAIWIDATTKGLKSSWLYAHNLSFDLSTTNLLTNLKQQGWMLTDQFSVNDRAPFFRLAKGSKRLVITDSWSWLPQALEVIGKAVKINKPDLPPADDIEALRHRCREDVRILETAICDLMDWWDRERLGNWSITGASCGWNTFRHKTSPKSIIIKPDKEGMDHDKSAVYGGRRDAWRIGSFRAGPYVELDFVEAHATLCAFLPMPKERLRMRSATELGPDRIYCNRWGAIARVVVETDEPRYPCRIGKEVWYPVGRFETTLCGPELAMAERRNELVQVISGRLHLLGNHMQPWARWCLAVSNGECDDTPAVAKIAAKSWGRSVIGKFASRTSSLVDKGPAIYGGYKVINGYDMPAQTKARWVMIDGTEYKFLTDQWSENAYPAVWAWVESELRVRMATVIDAIPKGALITCNTDGLIVDAKRLRMESARRSHRTSSERSDRAALNRWCQKVSEKTWPLVLRVKSVFNELNVLGPAQMEHDGMRRWSGVRKDAEETGPSTFTSRLWPGLAWQLEHGTTEGFLRPLRTVRAAGPYVQRWITVGGSVQPVRARRGPQGSELCRPHDGYRVGMEDFTLAGVQHPRLMELL